MYANHVVKNDVDRGTALGFGGIVDPFFLILVLFLLLSNRYWESVDRFFLILVLFFLLTSCGDRAQ